MKNLFIIAMLLVSIKTFSQCNTIKDSFTGKETTSYIIKVGGNMNIGDNISFAKEDGKKVIAYTWMVQGTSDYESKIEDTSLLIKFDDGEILKFIPSSDSKISNRGGYLAYVFIAELNNDDIEKLRSKNVQAARFGLLQDKGIDLNLTKKNLKEFKDAVSCISK